MAFNSTAGGKGSGRRPSGVSTAKVDSNWDRIFGNKSKNNDSADNSEMWENGELGCSAEHAVKVSAEETKAIMGAVRGSLPEVKKTNLIELIQKNINYGALSEEEVAAVGEFLDTLQESTPEHTFIVEL